MISIKELSFGEIPNKVNVVIEISKGSKVKYEIDKEKGVLSLDRILYTSMVYPFNYGFVPKSLCEDGDPADILVISSEPFLPGSVVKVKIIGLLEMEDEEGKDEKLISVPIEKIEPRFKNVNDYKDLPESVLEEIKHFFEHYKELEPGKWVKIKEWKGKDYAEIFLKNACKRFENV